MTPQGRRRESDRALPRHARRGTRRGGEHDPCLPQRFGRSVGLSCVPSARVQAAIPKTCADFSPIWTSAASKRRRSHDGSRQSVSSTVSLCRRTSQRRSCCGAGRSEARTQPAESALRRRGRWVADRSAPAGGGHDAAPLARLRAGATAMPFGNRLCDGVARVRIGGIAGLRRAAPPAHAGRARQRRQGADGAAQSGRHRAMADYLALRGRSRPRHRQQMAVSIIRRTGPSHAPAFRPRAQGLESPAASRRHGSRRMCCAMPSPATCCTTAPICASCRRCSAMRISRPRKSTRMCWKSA